MKRVKVLASSRAACQELGDPLTAAASISIVGLKVASPQQQQNFIDPRTSDIQITVIDGFNNRCSLLAKCCLL